MQEVLLSIIIGVPLEAKLLPKVKVNRTYVWVPVEEVIQGQRCSVYWKIGDGKIFVYDVENVSNLLENPVMTLSR